MNTLRPCARCGHENAEHWTLPREQREGPCAIEGCYCEGFNDVDESWDRWAQIEDDINAECHAILRDAGADMRADSYVGLFRRVKALAQREPHPEWAPIPSSPDRFHLAATEGLAEVSDLIDEGRVPPDIASFGELHQYIDANELAGLCESRSDWTIQDKAIVQTLMDLAIRTRWADLVNHTHAWHPSEDGRYCTVCGFVPGITDDERGR